MSVGIISSRLQNLHRVRLPACSFPTWNELPQSQRTLIAIDQLLSSYQGRVDLVIISWTAMNAAEFWE